MSNISLSPCFESFVKFWMVKSEFMDAAAAIRYDADE